MDGVNVDQAREFLASHHRGVLATAHARGRIQQSPVLATVDADGRMVISSRETAYKVRNLRRDPWAQFCAFTDDFFGPWVFVEGSAQVLSLPDAMAPLVDYYERVAGEHPDWEEYREQMRQERRVLIQVTIDRAGPDRHG